VKAIISFQNMASDIVLTVWTPVFVIIFAAIVFYALRPSNGTTFDEAARMPLRKD
jgi:cytochrome c oxidase cbb3-type subunit 4